MVSVHSNYAQSCQLTQLTPYLEYYKCTLIPFDSVWCIYKKILKKNSTLYCDFQLCCLLRISGYGFCCSQNVYVNKFKKTILLQEEVGICEDGSEETVSLLQPDSSFGEISILCNIPQPYTVRVCELCRLLRLDKQSFTNVLDIYFYDGRKILNNLLEVIIWLISVTVCAFTLVPEISVSGSRV